MLSALIPCAARLFGGWLAAPSSGSRNASRSANVARTLPSQRFGSTRLVLDSLVHRTTFLRLCRLRSNRVPVFGFRGRCAVCGVRCYFGFFTRAFAA